jgi:ATP-binding cassette subfamily F protein 3
MQGAEREVERLTAEIAELDALLADPQFYVRDVAAAQRAGVERGQLVKRRGAAEEAWLEASEAYEQASAEAASATDA